MNKIKVSIVLSEIKGRNNGLRNFLNIAYLKMKTVLFQNKNLSYYMLTAEVIPIGEKNSVALALQCRGFKVLSIGDTITIGGEKEIFENFFKVKMKKQTKNELSGIPSIPKTEFYRPVTPPIIPEEFRSLIKEVIFIEPPEFF